MPVICRFSYEILNTLKGDEADVPAEISYSSYQHKSLLD